jgi:hypothetical protein
MKNDRRIPKTIVVELLEQKGLSMERKTIKGERRAWVVSDGKAFPSLKAVYSFYKASESQKKNAIGALLDKFKEKSDD